MDEQALARPQFGEIDEFQIHLYTEDGIRDEIEVLVEIPALPDSELDLPLLSGLTRADLVDPDEETMELIDSARRLLGSLPADALAEMQGRPVYLGLAFAGDRTLKMKPQNLLANLPLALRT